MKSLIRSLPKLLLLALLLALAPAALASNTWYVDGVNGNDNNDCRSPQTACKTIRHAKSLASSGDMIMVAPATYKENLTIKKSLKIIGSGAATSIIDGNQAGTVITISEAKAHLTISNFTIQNGSGYYAGGMTNFGTLTINKVAISGNSATYAGGIANYGVALTVNNSTISGNSASSGGGGIDSQAPATINNSTITGNTVPPESGVGTGGIWNDVTTLTINNSTITLNTGSQSGGIYNFYGTVTLQNSIVASSTGGNCGGNTFNSEGYNLSDDNTCNFSGPGDMNNTPAKLGKLGNHGGPTPTIPELLGSPTVDAGNPNGCTDSNGNLLTKDQRGYPRPGAHKQDKRCDMGAFERQTD